MSETTEGRMQLGGTRSRVMMRSCGRPTSRFITRNGRSCVTHPSIFPPQHTSSVESVFLLRCTALNCGKDKAGSKCAQFETDNQTYLCRNPFEQLQCTNRIDQLLKTHRRSNSATQFCCDLNFWSKFDTPDLQTLPGLTLRSEAPNQCSFPPLRETLGCNSDIPHFPPFSWA